jgi:hypothetical protein
LKNDYLLTGASRFIIYHQKSEREREKMDFIAVFLSFMQILIIDFFFIIKFLGRTTNGASGQSSTSPEKTVTIPRSATLSGQSMWIGNSYAWSCMCACILGNDGESENRATVSRSTSAVASMSWENILYRNGKQIS